MSLFKKRRQQADFAAEIESHIAAETDRLREDGMSGVEAEHTARRKFGNILRAEEQFYEGGRMSWMDDLRKDIWHALRQVRQSPTLAVTVVVTLALGIGATTAVFSIVDAVLLRSSLYPSAQRLVRIEESSVSGALFSDVLIRDYQRLANRSDLFEKIAPYVEDTVTLTGNGEPEQVTAVRCRRLFPVLGVHAVLGRTLISSDEDGLRKVAVLSDRLWHRRYHADPGVIGRGITFSDEAYTIVGVMPADFEFRYPQAELWTPLTPTSQWPEVVARLQAGVSVSQAQSAMAIVADQMRQEQPKDRAGFRIIVTPWSDLPDQKYKLTLIFVFAAIGQVMLIACVDVGCLLLTRAVQRQKEIAIRASLGAGLWRIVRQLLSESLVLAVLGSLAGIVVARSLLHILTAQLGALPIVLPHLQLSGLSERVFAFNVALCLLVAVLCSLAPILLAIRTDLQAVIHGGQAAEGRRSSPLFSTLIALEAGLAFLLLVGSGLMIRSLVHLQQADHGFRPDHVLTLRVPVGTVMQPRATGKYDTRPRQMAYYHEILEHVKVLPGIKAAAIVNNLPLSGTGSSLSFNLGDPDGESSARTISPDYFAAMGIPLVAGRIFADSDKTGAREVAIINEHLAHQLFANRNPLGKRLTVGLNTPGPTIVGVVKDSSQMSYESPANAEVYIPYQQYIFATFLSTIVVRTEGEPGALAVALRKQIWAVDPNQPIVKVETMEEVIANSTWRPRFSAWIFSVLSGLSILLTALGVYGVIAYTSNLRAHEVGIRIALGASANDILPVILRGAMIPVVLGVGVSVIAALPLSRLITSLLYGVSSSDPLTYLSAVGILLMIGVAASARPAWRAATRDPLETLRAE